MVTEKLVHSLKELLNEEEKKPEALIESIIPKGYIQISGRPGMRKSLLTSSIICSLVSGKPFLGTFGVIKKQKCLLYDLEMNINVSVSRFRTIFRGLDIKEEELNEILKKDNLCIRNEFLTNNISKELEICKNYDVIIIDSYINILSGDENSSINTNNTFKAFIKKLLNDGKTVITIHHVKKIRSSDKINIYDVRGSSAIGGQGDMSFALQDTSIKSEDDILRFQTMNVNVIKNRLGLNIEEHFHIDITFNKKNNSTDFKFRSLSKQSYKKPRDIIKENIVEFLKNESKTREEIVEEFKKTSEYKDDSIILFLSELKQAGLIDNLKQGIYSIAKKKEENKK